MNRQTFLFIVLLIIFLDFPRGGPDPDLEKNAAVLAQYRGALQQGHDGLLKSEYYMGYGNLTGLKLSYEDALAHRNILEWPFREYTPLSPWQETQEHSLLPDLVSGKIRLFWGKTPVTEDGKAYLLNILSHAYGEFEILHFDQPLTPIPMPLPAYLKEFYNSYRQARYDEEKERYEADPENNLPPAEIPEIVDKTGNITTYTLGKLAFLIQPLKAVYPELQTARLGLDLYEDATLVHVKIEISDTLAKDRNRFAVFAVYFQNTGALVGLTNLAKFRGTNALPHFAMSEEAFNKSRTLVSRFYSTMNLEKDFNLNLLTNDIDAAESLCEIALYLQLEKTAYTRPELQYIDDELRLRQGLPLPPIPDVEISHALLYSPDCGLVFEKKADTALTGLRLEVKLDKMRRAFVGMLILTLLELSLFLRQAKVTRTPSDLSNVSKLSVVLLSVYDLVLAVIMMLIMWVSDLYLICACNTVLNLLLFYVFELRYYASIDAAQLNERGMSWWQILRGYRQSELGVPRDLEAQTAVNGLPAADPASAQTTNTNAVPNATPTTVPPPPDPTVIGPSPSSGVSHFAFSFVLSFAIAMVVLASTEWSVNRARIFEYWLFIIVNSYWIPQFFRNTLKNRSKSVLWEFVFGTSLVRLIPLAYVCLDKANPFGHPPNPLLFFTVSSWLAAQMLLLYLQSRLGARFWLNSKWLPEQYNYHPVIHVKDLENGFSRDILANLKAEPGQDVSMYESDCAICMSTLKFPVLMSESVNKKPYEALMREVMITPCYHSFHSECLEDWMIYKLQCPVCRTSLPPV